MFNIHSTELILVAIVALIVIGPEKLPGTIRTASLWIGRFRRSFYRVKADIERELNTDEIRRQLHNESVLAEIEETKNQIQDAAQETKQSLENVVNSDDFDPGASTETLKQQANEEAAAVASEFKEASEEVAAVSKQLYGTGKNPKLADAESTSENSDAESDKKDENSGECAGESAEEKDDSAS